MNTPNHASDSQIAALVDGEHANAETLFRARPLMIAVHDEVSVPTLARALAAEGLGLYNEGGITVLRETPSTRAYLSQHREFMAQIEASRTHWGGAAGEKARQKLMDQGVEP